jgi:hypothetical protein
MDMHNYIVRIYSVNHHKYIIYVTHTPYKLYIIHQSSNPHPSSPTSPPPSHNHRQQ